MLWMVRAVEAERTGEDREKERVGDFLCRRGRSICAGRGKEMMVGRGRTVRGRR